ASGVVYRVGAQVPTKDVLRVEKPRSELEALRKENELLKLNLQVVLEKVRAQEAELHTLRAAGLGGKKIDRTEERLRSLGVRVGGKGKVPLNVQIEDDVEKRDRIKKLYLLREKLLKPNVDAGKKLDADVMKLVEDALKRLQAAPDAEAQRRAAKALDLA